MINKEFEELIIKYNILEQAFDNIRLVDPIKSIVLDLKEVEEGQNEFKCFHFLGLNKVCDNCIAIRAYHDNRPYIKMEYTSNDVYVIIAIPIDLPDRKVVMEIIKNATSSLILDSSDSNIYTEVHELIDKMNNLTMMDSLTGIFNRRYMNERLPMAISSGTLSRKPLSIIMADIDFFKSVNDNFGHLCGDHTLKKFAQLLSSCLSRGTDWVSRFGGEEFLICLPGASLKRAVEIAELMRKSVERSTIEFGEYIFNITASFGVSTAIPGMNATMDELIERADAKMYEAKHNGRNRVEA